MTPLIKLLDLPTWHTVEDTQPFVSGTGEIPCLHALFLFVHTFHSHFGLHFYHCWQVKQTKKYYMYNTKSFDLFLIKMPMYKNRTDMYYVYQYDHVLQFTVKWWLDFCWFYGYLPTTSQKFHINIQNKCRNWMIFNT